MSSSSEMRTVSSGIGDDETWRWRNARRNSWGQLFDSGATDQRMLGQ
ncbi:hypothetical protein RBSH_00081 [Rhodopirellula baltica SH28]|uniref:Uncharacterized protein n=1 Tax=Rhodopirellula baltica SH28 TaxID=993517 RepID=K5EEZ8_RHOBT|nr:hypothetical protein RBSH_00081 [Rhodopirellula baltica SH28]